MNEPIPVSLAVRAVERAIRECDAATPGPWRSIDWVIVARAIWLSLAPLAYIRNNDNAIEERDANAAFIVLARAGFRASLVHLLLGLRVQEIGGNQVAIGSERVAVAPMIDHYDATAPGWRTA